MDTSSSLLIRVRDSGDAAAWREFVAVYQPLIVAYAIKQGLPAPAAHDAAQDVFIKLLKALPTFQLDRGRGRFRTWLWQVTFSAVVDRTRREGRRNRAERVWKERRATPEEPAEWRAMLHWRVMEHALKKVGADVSPKTWSCFDRHLRQRRPAAEVAAEPGVSVNSVYVNASRVLDLVRKARAELMGDLSDGADDLPG
jgi:RNA polymerase sigma-70 factor (ECF subfamily)